MVGPSELGLSLADAYLAPRAYYGRTRYALWHQPWDRALQGDDAPKVRELIYSKAIY